MTREFHRAQTMEADALQGRRSACLRRVSWWHLLAPLRPESHDAHGGYLRPDPAVGAAVIGGEEIQNKRMRGVAIGGRLLLFGQRLTRRLPAARPVGTAGHSPRARQRMKEDQPVSEAPGRGVVYSTHPTVSFGPAAAWESSAEWRPDRDARGQCSPVPGDGLEPSSPRLASTLEGWALVSVTTTSTSRAFFPNLAANHAERHPLQPGSASIGGGR
jgi:hypothetical protein